MNVNSESRINSEQAKEAIYNAHTKLPIVYTKEEVDAIIGTLTSGGETTYNTGYIDSVVNTEFKRSGYTKEVSREDRWTESNEPNCIYDTAMGSYVIDGVVYNLEDFAEEF